MSENLKEIRKQYAVTSIDSDTEIIKESEDVNNTLDIVEEQINERIKELETEYSRVVKNTYADTILIRISELKRLLGK